ncbi:MAG: type II secretion system F family protein [Lachnospiraceae bacterium]|nr:type II secretion system F family protein [Lachnospiraceae bacterium]
MIYVYGGSVIVLLFFTLLFRIKDKPIFSIFNQKEHTLLFFYPFAARICTLLQKLNPGRKDSKAKRLLKSIYVKENVDGELSLFYIKKTAAVLAILTAVSLLGCIVCFVRSRSTFLTEVERNPYGKGAASYPVEVEYQGKAEEIDLSIEEVKLTEEEILTKMDESMEGITKEILGENENAETITRPIRFISNYQGIQIFWEIEDPKKLNYNGEISVDIVDNEPCLLQLFATLSLGDIQKTYVIPIVLHAPDESEQDKLIREITEKIEQSNSEYEKRVVLPTKVNGEDITFKTRQEHNEIVFLILGAVLIAAVLIGLDKGLEETVKKRKAQMTLDFSEIVSKMSLLYEAGLSIYKAWEKIVAEQEKKGEERYAYREMKLVLEKISSGVSEKEAYRQFGKRCGLHSYIKLGNLLEQNLSKGTKGMKQSLQEEVEESLEERKKLARKKGEEASTKLLVPMVLMLLVVIVIIAVPALMSMNI